MHPLPHPLPLETIAAQTGYDVERCFAIVDRYIRHMTTSERRMLRGTVAKLCSAHWHSAFRASGAALGLPEAVSVEVNGKTYHMPLIGGSAPAYTDTWREAFAAAEAGGRAGA